MSTETSVLQKVPRRTRRLLDQLIANRQLTQPGLDWLVACSDPFHDTDIRLQGYPDISSARSLTQCITLTQNISLVTGKDLHVFFMPITQLYDASQGVLAAYYIRDNGYQGGANASTAELNPGVNAISVNTGLDWRTSNTAAAMANNVDYPHSFGAGQARLIACGWEVVNTTPVVNMGGAVTSYRSPNTTTQSYVGVYVGTTPGVFTYVPAVLGALPPGTQSDAALFPNSRTWQSSEGLYQVAVMNSLEQGFRTPAPGYAGFIDVPSQTQLENDTDRIAFLPKSSFSTTNTNWTANCVHMMNWDVSGAVFVNNTGFTQQLQLTVKYYVERLPTISDQNLLVLAHEPAPYDPIALEIYSRCMAKLPVAVPVGENPLGEWFDQVMSAVGGALPTIGGALATIFPPAAAIGAGLGGVALSVGQWNKQAREAEIARREEQSARDKAANALNGNSSATKNLTSNNAVLLQAGGGVPVIIRKKPKPLPKPPNRRN